MRTQKMHRKYKTYQKTHFKSDSCVLCDKAKDKKNFKHWRLVKNLFPWDRIATAQDMIFPKRHVRYEKLTKAEKAELEKMKAGYLNKKYDILAEATDRIKSIPEHYHLHLILLK